MPRDPVSSGTRCEMFPFDREVMILQDEFVVL
jgi:hypothetical protein